MPKTPLSASRIKTLQSCSWEFWTAYHLKLPDIDNSGNIMGSCVHNCYEFLGKKSRRKYFDELIKTQKLKSVKSLHRYCLMFLKSRGLDPFADTLTADGGKKPHIVLTEEMLFAGLNYDFFGQEKNPDESHTEIAFDFDIEEGDLSYRFRGFIDKLFLFKEKSLAVIRDFKSSKKAYEGNEVVDNLQDLMYRLAVKKLFPEYKKKQTEFVFLQYKDKDQFSIKTPIACDDELDGLEYFLTDIQEIIENFDEDMAKSNFAKDKGFPSKEEGFSGLVKCGSAGGGKTVEYPGQMKKDGSKPLWFCKARFAYYFYVIIKDDKILDSKTEEKDLRKLKEGEKIEKRFYPGCFAWRNQEYNKKMNQEARELGFTNTFEEEKEVDEFDFMM